MAAPDSNRNALWSRLVAEELARSGVEAAVVSPGSRSAPLAFALASEPRIRLYTALDERSGGFFALGLARASGAPVALVCTSGTAAANYLPAVVEASRSRVPLVVLTADRPHELRDTGANQTIDQVHLFGRYPRWFHDLPTPDPRDGPLRALRSVVCRAVAEARGPPAGPAHLNLPFRKPLEPTPVAGDVPADLAADALRGRAADLAWTAPTTGRAPPPSPADVAAGLAHLRRARRGLVVVGPRSVADGLPEAALALARATGFPLLADPLSGARFHAGAASTALGGYDAFLAAGFDPGPPDLVLRLGAPPTSAALERYLERHRAATHVVVDEAPAGDPLHLAEARFACDPASWCRAVATEASPGDAAWTERWRRAEAVAWKSAEAAFAGAPFEGVLAAEVAASVPAGGLLFVSNSLPVRDVDRFARPRDEAVRCLGNRGASGIDGIVSSALGAAAADARPAVAYLGDLALLHDVGGLALAAQAPPVTFVVVNNDGGGVFELLPAAAHDPPFTRLLRAPHGLDLSRASALYGIPHERVADRAALRRALAAPATATRVVEVASDGKANAARREDARRALASALAE